VKGHCETCPTAGDCKTAFGKFWGEKSRGGVGCDTPFRYAKEVPSAKCPVPGATNARSTKHQARGTKQEILI